MQQVNENVYMVPEVTFSTASVPGLYKRYFLKCLFPLVVDDIFTSLRHMYSISEVE